MYGLQTSTSSFAGSLSFSSIYSRIIPHKGEPTIDEYRIHQLFSDAYFRPKLGFPDGNGCCSTQSPCAHSWFEDQRCTCYYHIITRLTGKKKTSLFWFSGCGVRIWEHPRRPVLQLHLLFLWRKANNSHQQQHGLLSSPESAFHKSEYN